MPNPTELVIKAVLHASSRGLVICRGPVFDWGTEYRALPRACNALGAILVLQGCSDLVRAKFDPRWQAVITDHLDVDWGWVFRFSHGWDRGNLLVYAARKNGKDIEVEDDISRLGDKLARQLCTT